MVYSEIANMMVLLLTLFMGAGVAFLKWWMELDGSRLDDGYQPIQKCCSLATRGASIGVDSLPCLVRVRAGNLLPDSLE